MVASENFKKYFEEIDALKNYDRVKKERDELAKEKPKLKDRISGLEENVEKQSNEIDGLNSRLKEEAKGRADAEKKLKSESKRADDLGGRLKLTSEELDCLKSYKVKFVDGKELTVEETKEALVEAHNDEIEKRTGEKFQELKSGYEAKMPQLIHERLIEVLKKPLWPVEIANVISTKTKERVDGILRNRLEWPSWFWEYYHEEVSVRVNRALDEEFDRRVDERSQEIAMRKLEKLKSQAWPEWFSQNVRPEIDKNVFKALKGSWAGWACDKCGTKFELTLAEHDIAELLKNGRIELECPDLNCVDSGLLGLWSSRHKIKISMESLIVRLAEKTEIVLVPVKKAASVA